MKATIHLFSALVLFGCTTPTDNIDDQPPGLVGVWSWSQQSFSNEDTSWVWTNVDGQMIFTENHYSVIWVSKSEPRDTVPATKTLESMTAEELREILDPVIANSGNYRIEGDSILLFREVAKWPNAMARDRQPQKIPMPVNVTQDSLVWHFGDYEAIWVRKE